MDEREVLRGRIRDLWNRTREGEYLNHTGFLPLDLQSYARRLIREDKIPERSGSGPFCMFSGGFEEADRKMILFVPSYMNEEDVKAELAKGEGAFTCVRIAAVRSGFSAPPDHRDYLGSLMNLGITREQIGDIICREDEAFVFAVKETAPFICGELTRVRHTTVTAEALRLIEQEKVFADGHIITSASYTPSPGERISVRGYGKFRYLGADKKTRKGRLIASYERYI